MSESRTIKQNPYCGSLKRSEVRAAVKKVKAARQGLTVRYEADNICIDGCFSILPIDLLDAAYEWVRLAGEKDWPLKDPHGERLMLKYEIERIEI